MTNNGPKMPSDLSELLSTSPDTLGFQPEWVVPEYETKLDKFKGSGRNHDMIILGNTNGRNVVISVEAKVDESFGDIVNDYVARSVKANPRSKIPDRIKQLSTAIFGTKDVGELRYQLIHAVAGTLIEAKNQKAAQAVIIINEFVPFGKFSKKAKQNEEALQSL